jgi:hypothetical protein
MTIKLFDVSFKPIPLTFTGIGCRDFDFLQID